MTGIDEQLREGFVTGLKQAVESAALSRRTPDADVLARPSETPCIERDIECPEYNAVGLQHH